MAHSLAYTHSAEKHIISTFNLIMQHYFKISIFVAIISLASLSAVAKDVTICRSPTTGATQSSGPARLNDKTVFTCDNGMKGTIRDSYKLGWRVIQLTDMEDDPTKPTKFTLILLEKD